MALDDSRKPDRPGARRQDALGNKVPDPAEELVLIEKELTELRIAFEQFLLGIERVSPLRRKDKLSERIRRLKSSGVVRSTSQKFKLDQLQSKFGSYERMWTRSVQEREAGTYRADLFKLRRKQERQQEAAAQPPPAPKAAPPSEPTLTDGQIRALYNTYLLARQRTGEPVSGLSFDGLAKTLRRQVPQLLDKHQCQAIDFKVVIKDGKALLKAVPRK